MKSLTMKTEPQPTEKRELPTAAANGCWLQCLVRPLCVTLQNGDIIERPSGHRQIYLNGKITNDAPKLSFRASLTRWIFRHCVRPFLAENNESHLILYTENRQLTPRIRQYEEPSSTQLDVLTLRCL